mmetsp:Transcript_10929/g.40740  ORF Transcript_10929/g.40740 Transcript_10929/m.40740 type:complete len:105 (-) Transcript_10929:3771-4085(-)
MHCLFIMEFLDANVDLDLQRVWFWKSQRTSSRRHLLTQHQIAAPLHSPKFITPHLAADVSTSFPNHNTLLFDPVHSCDCKCKFFLCGFLCTSSQNFKSPHVFSS